ncbi:hypothetical protein EKK58_12065 [Candidatus Dependentiae bacterium]|nr:MAG: hypothetical protein EKK58_12065 [Candidatus Dependentiae bacterium]
MTTLKKAYESIGETPKVGDHLFSHGKIRFVEGWNFNFREDSITLYRAELFIVTDPFTITRDGKLIFPNVKNKVQEAENQVYHALRINKDGINCNLVTNAISALIDAKIKEALK